MSERTYRIDEVTYSIEREGKRAGMPSVFVRFTETNFLTGSAFTLDELLARIEAAWSPDTDTQPRWIVLTGGEPTLQLDLALSQFLHERGYLLAVETNGAIELPRVQADMSDNECAIRGTPLPARLLAYPYEWIVVSPKVAEHAIKQRCAHEVRYVRGYGQAKPETSVDAMNYMVSPARDKDTEYCIGLAKENPPWQLSIQMNERLTEQRESASPKML